MRLLLPACTHERVADEIARVAPDAELVLMRDDGVFLVDGKEVPPEQLRFDAAWASRDLYILNDPRGLRAFMIAILKSPTVRWMHTGGAGVDHPVFASIAAKGVRLSNSDSGAVAMAEYVLGGVLDFYQRNDRRRARQADRAWEPTPFREVAGTTWLVFGLGNIGREVSTRARAFGARVIGVRRTATGDEPVDEMIAPGDIAQAVGRADVVVLCAALNESTRHLVDAEFLTAMRPKSVLVNVARGAIVDEAALLASLERGVPEAALLDVFETEPLPVDSPFWHHPRVRMTPHCAAGGSGTGHRSDLGFLANLERYVTGEPLISEVDPSELQT